MPLPDKAGCHRILTDTLQGFVGVFPKLTELLKHREMEEVAEICVGMDGRQILAGDLQIETPLPAIAIG